MMNKMKVLVLVVMMVMGASGAMSLMAEEAKAFDQCTGTVKVYTSEMKKSIKVNESKLTSLRYVKKICQITDTYKGEDYTVYELDGGKGKFINFKGGNKICLIVKDGELYGRWAEISDHGAALTCNLHDNRCYQRTHSETYGSWTYTYYYKDENLESWAKEIQDKMLNWANVWGLNK